MTTPRPSVRPLTGRHVLIAVVCFFAVVIGLDSLFTVWAVRTFPGEVSTRAYEDGLVFNEALASRRAQANLGWRARVAQASRPGAISASFVDAKGKPIDGLIVNARFTRPATQVGASVARLGATGSGAYAGAASLADGAWDLTLTARDGAGHSFEAQRRLIWR